MSPIRVLHLVAGNLFGGVETLLLTIADTRRLAPGFEPEFATCFDDRLASSLRRVGVPVFDLGQVRIHRLWTVVGARRRLARLIERERPDVAVTHGCWPHVVLGAAVRASGVPLVFWAHDALRGEHWLERWATLCWPDLVLANSRFTLGTVHEVFPGAPARVFYAPVEPSTAHAGAREAVRAELGAPRDTVVVVMASRLEPWKGHELLLDALARVRSSAPWVAWIAGGPQRPHEERYLARLRARAESLGLATRVRFLGQRSDLGDVLAASDVHCQPNTGPEPFGRVFVEALHAGLPVVTTRMGGALEIVDETCGILVPPEPEAVGAAIDSLVSDEGERRRLGAAGPARARRLTDPGVRVPEFVSLLENLTRPRVRA